MNYRISAASPTEELITLGRIFSEVGDYMSTILDSEHLSLARKCATRLKKVVGELTARRRIKSEDELYEISGNPTAGTDLSPMTVSELYTLYRGWQIRHKQRLAEGREHLTYYYEGRIVRELLSRKASDRDEQLKIDYCMATYNNELDNMSFIFSLPVSSDSNKAYPDTAENYSPEELVSLIRKHTDYRDIIGREILVEYVDYALDLLQDDQSQPEPYLAETLEELRGKDIIRIPVLPKMPAVS